MKKFFVGLFAVCFASNAFARPETIPGTGDMWKIIAEVVYYAEDGRVVIDGHNAMTGVYDPYTEWKNVWLSSNYPVFTGDSPNFPAGAVDTIDTPTLVGFTLPAPSQAASGRYDLGRIAMAGLSESDFLFQNWTVTGNARSSDAPNVGPVPNITGTKLTYTPVPEPRFLAHGGLLGLIGLWLLGRRMI